MTNSMMFLIIFSTKVAKEWNEHFLTQYSKTSYQYEREIRFPVVAQKLWFELVVEVTHIFVATKKKSRHEKHFYKIWILITALSIFLHLPIGQYYRQCTPIITKGEMTKRENRGIKLCTLAHTAFIHRYANVHNNLCGASMWPERKMKQKWVWDWNTWISGEVE